MARYIIGKKLDAYNGLTDTQTSGTMRIRSVGKVGTPGRIVGMGSWLGADTAQIDRAKLAAYLIDPSTLDPTVKLLETPEFALQSIWNGNGVGGANIERGDNYPFLPYHLRPLLWYLPETLSNIANGAAVSSFASVGSSVTALANATGAEQPLYIAGVKNGYPCIRFDGIDDDLTAVGVNVPATSSIFIAFKTPADTTADQRPYVTSVNRHTFRLHLSGVGNAHILQTPSTDNYSSAVATSSWEIHSHIYDPVALRGARNGLNVLGPVASGGAAAANLIVGGSGTAQWADIDFLELIVFPYVMTIQQQQLVEGYLSKKYAIALDASHPYVTAALPNIRGPVVLTGQELGSGAVGLGTVRRPANVFTGGKKWEQATTGLILPDPMVPTVETVDDKDISSYVIVEENRPPVVTMLTPVNGEVVKDQYPNFTISTTDPDRDDGFPDYIKSAVVRVWDKIKGALLHAGSRSFSPTPSGYAQTAQQTFNWGWFWPPADLGTRMSFSLYAPNIVQANATPVASWPDDSGNANHAIQGTGANQPTFRTNQIATTSPAVDFDGTNDYLSTTVQNSPNNDEAVFVVIRFDSLAAIRSILGTSNTVAGRVWRVTTAGQLQLVANNVGVVAQTVGTVTTATWYILHFVQRPGALRMGINGIVENSYAEPGFSVGNTLIGVTDTTASFPLDGQIAHMIRMKASDMRPGDEERIIGWLAWGYGLTANLPQSNPYRFLPSALRFNISPSTEQKNAAGAVTFSTNRYEYGDATYFDGVAMATWLDRRAVPQNATQATGANQPAWRANRLNGYGVVDFDGVNDYFSQTGISASVRDEAIFAVINLRSLSNTPEIVGATGANGGRALVVNTDGRLSVNKHFISIIGVTTAPNVVVANDWAIVHMVLRAGDWELGINGTIERGVETTALTAGLTTLVGAGSAGTTNFVNGMIAALIRLPASGLGIDDVERWVGRLAWRYGLQEKLPDTHMYRFKSPDDPVEYHWTMEVRDEIGGITGTGYGARSTDNDTPDGTSQFFLQPYMWMTSPSLPSKVTSLTPPIISATYNNVLSMAAKYVKIRFLKKNSASEYEISQTSHFMPITVASGATLQVSWGLTGLRPLDIDTDYALEWWVIDAADNTSGWISRSYFHTNYIPDQAVVTSPANGVNVSGLPTLTFSVDDADDTGVAWFAPVPFAIWELHAGTFGSGANQFGVPGGMAIDVSGNLFIADGGNTRIVKSDANIAQISTLATTGQPQDLDIEQATGNIWYGNGVGLTIRRINSAGTVLETYTFAGWPQVYFLDLGAPGTALYLFWTWKNNPYWRMAQANNLASGGSDPLSSVRTGNANLLSAKGISYYNNKVWVADNTDISINRYDISPIAAGSIVQPTWEDSIDDTDHLSNPNDVGVHPYSGNVWVTDKGRYRVEIFSYFGDFLGEFGGIGNGNGQFSAPNYLTFSNDGLKVYVSDASLSRIARFRIATEADKAAKGVCGEVLVKGPITVPNMSFDTDTTGWTYSEAHAAFIQTLTVMTDTPNDGKGYLRISMSAGPPSGSPVASVNFQLITASGSEFPVVEGFTYGVKAKFRRSNTTFYGQIGIQWMRSDNSVVSTSWSNVFRPDPWTTTYAPWLDVGISDKAPIDAVKAAIILWSGVDGLPGTYPASVDWDNIRIDDAVRYVRAATFLSGNDYSYTMISNDMPANGAYTFQVRGRDGSSPGPWSDALVLNKTAGPTATLISPTPGQVFTTATPLFAWQLLTGTQWAYMVDVLDTNGVTIYSSGWIQNANARSFLVPVSAGLVDTGSYLGRLWIDDGKSQVLI